MCGASIIVPLGTDQAEASAEPQSHTVHSDSETGELRTIVV